MHAVDSNDRIEGIKKKINLKMNEKEKKRNKLSNKLEIKTLQDYQQVFSKETELESLQDIVEKLESQ